VVPGSVSHQGETIRFRVADRDNPSESLTVTYTGTVTDPFRAGREIVLTGSVRDGTFVGQRDTLITKCPSKFTEQRQS
jgi:cytochrome c-type biogenesis protein CcmE